MCASITCLRVITAFSIIISFISQPADAHVIYLDRNDISQQKMKHLLHTFIIYAETLRINHAFCFTHFDTNNNIIKNKDQIETI